MSTARRGQSASLVLDGSGKVLIAGGDNGATLVSPAEIYSPAANTFAPAAAVADPRENHTATLLTDGRVLLAGGDNGVRALQSAEIFIPKLHSSTITSSMIVSRAFHTATRLNDGTVLITGGSPALGPSALAGALDSAELFEPSRSNFVSLRRAMTTARTQHTATLLRDGKTILITGGANDGGVVQASAELLDITTGDFTAIRPMSTARRLHTATLLKDGTVLIVGGVDSVGAVLSSAEIYHPRTRTFSPTASPMKNGRAHHTAALLGSGQVLIAGGHDDHSAEVYNPATRQFTPSAMEMNAARDFHTATLLASGQVLLAGGTTCGVFSDPACTSPPSSPSAELFNPGAGGSFTATSGAMSQPRISHTATLLLDGTVLIAGGQASTSQVLDSAELYNSAGGAFSSAGKLVQARSFHTATVLADGRILLAGGFGDASMAAIDSAELYDPGAGGGFVPTSSMKTARDSATATLLRDGRVLVAGGEDSFGGTPLMSAELYDPSTGNFTRTTGDMKTPRAGHTATLLATGMVLITGGSPANPGTATAELFDPADGTFSLTAPMNEPRQFHKAILLADNRVLLAGGAGDLSAEVYDPGAQAFSCVAGLDTSMTPPVCNSSMMEIRFEHTATLLGDGTVLIAGGDTFTAFGLFVEHASAELFDPSRKGGAFTAIGSMTTERTQHTATLLNDGRVLIAGGTHSHAALPSAELFAPR